MIRWQFSGRTSAPLSPLQRRFDDFLTIDMGRCALFLWLASQIAGQLLTIAFVYLLLYLSAISREPCVSYGHEPPFKMVAIFPRNFCPMPMTSKLKKTTQLSAQQTFQVCGPICIFVRICTIHFIVDGATPTTTGNLRGWNSGIHSTKSTSDVDNGGRWGQREQDVLISHVASNDETPFLSGQETSDKSTPKTTTKRKSFVKLTKIAFNFFFSEIIFRRIHIDEQLSTSFKWMKKKLTWFSMKFKCKFESFSRQKFE